MINFIISCWRLRFLKSMMDMTFNDLRPLDLAYGICTMKKCFNSSSNNDGKEILVTKFYDSYSISSVDDYIHQTDVDTTFEMYGKGECFVEQSTWMKDED